MILIGTDDGIYRWFDGCGWPIFHSLQGRAIVSLASPGAGLIAAVDREGVVLESVNNGMDWQVIPGPHGSGTTTPTRLAVWGEPETIVLATKPLALHRRVIGAPLPRPAATSPGSLGQAWAGRRGVLPRGRRRCLHPESAPAHARFLSGACWAPPRFPAARSPPGHWSMLSPRGEGLRPPGSSPSETRASGGASTKGQPGSNAPACRMMWSPSGPFPFAREPSSRPPPRVADSVRTTARPGKTAAPASKTPVTSPRSRSSPTTPTSSSPARPPPSRRRRRCPRRGTPVRAL